PPPPPPPPPPHFLNPNDGNPVRNLGLVGWDMFIRDRSLITVEGDKSFMEVPCRQAGIFKEIKVSVGNKTETGKLFMFFDTADGAAAAPPAQEEKKEAAPA
ncbi:biotin/lipoyl-containing protein, partial [Enterobacter hormaechei]